MNRPDCPRCPEPELVARDGCVCQCRDSFRVETTTAEPCQLAEERTEPCLRCNGTRRESGSRTLRGYACERCKGTGVERTGSIVPPLMRPH